jgi:hypothetical protein
MCDELRFLSSATSVWDCGLDRRASYSSLSRRGMRVGLHYYIGSMADPLALVGGRRNVTQPAL